ncbi:hypothetical protein K443DRAFT_624672 [Laccaria amethystina LaAM-08-1]|uniref:Uncharacterized protein n=1 Tax=Laccaria amethystina LaAM-08-1 TaxID=1095629 RepID=A0A0C9X2F2_9AGAR|nr:hypothetical protein K443DRAFT_624672 [Laccaria amethystina LaAM-08-1]
MTHCLIELTCTCLTYTHLMSGLGLVIVVMAGSKGKEAFRRPLRQLKTPPEKAQLC